MMQVQIMLSVKGNDDNTISVYLLEREDANDTERELAKNIQNMIMAVMEDLRDELPAGEVQIEVIE